jgi:hypothetical protein
MARPDDIDHILKSWPYDATDLSARLVRAADGRKVLQMRVEMGLLQMEVDHRPDGTRPGGADTYFQHLRAREKKLGGDFVLSPEECEEADREFVQFYHRRVCWLRLRDFRRAVRDADHTLAFMDFAKRHSPSEEWTLSHEQYRPFVLFHRTQAKALAVLEDKGAEAALEEITEGLEKIRAVYSEFDSEERFEDDELASRLEQMRDSFREQFKIGRTLQEQLADAVAAEQYELAARIRDEIARRGK